MLNNDQAVGLTGVGLRAEPVLFALLNDDAQVYRIVQADGAREHMGIRDALQHMKFMIASPLAVFQQQYGAHFMCDRGDSDLPPVKDSRPGSRRSSR